MGQPTETMTQWDVHLIWMRVRLLFTKTVLVRVNSQVLSQQA